MEALKLKDFLNYRFLSGVQYAPDGGKAAFVVSNANEEENSYERRLWLWDGQLRQLTDLGKEGAFCWEDADHILFPADRSAKERKRREAREEFTAYYRLSMSGGEALPAFTLPFAATGLRPLGEGVYLALGSIDARRPDYFEMTDAARAEVAKEYAAEKDYVVFDEIPFWGNGEGVINKRRQALFRISLDPWEIRRVTEDNPFNTVVELTEPIHYPANSERAAEIYLALEHVKPTGVAAIDGADGDWGLDEPLAVITLTGSRAMTLTLGRTESLCTLRVDDGPAVYTVDEDSLAFLAQVTVPYLAEQLPGLVALNRITALRVTAGDEVFDIRVDQAEGSYLLNGQSVAQEDFLPAYQQLIGLLIERYVAEPEHVGEPRVLLEYTLQDGTVWPLAFAAYDDSFDLVVREDCARFLISRSKVDAAVDALRALMH